MVFDQYQRYETISRMISIIKRQEETDELRKCILGGRPDLRPRSDPDGKNETDAGKNYGDLGMPCLQLYLLQRFAFLDIASCFPGVLAGFVGSVSGSACRLSDNLLSASYL